jgi:hypothetical protein
VAWCSDPDFRGLFAPFNRGYLSRSYDDTLFTVLPEVGHTVGLGRAQPIDYVALFAEDENRAPEGKGGGINRPGITCWLLIAPQMASKTYSWQCAPSDSLPVDERRDMERRASAGRMLKRTHGITCVLSTKWRTGNGISTI